MSGLDDLLQEADENEVDNMNAQGFGSEYELWRESMPNTRIDQNEVQDTFIQSRDVELAAQDGRLSVTTGGERVAPVTDVPTPGPDDEGTGPDEPRDPPEDGPSDENPDPTDVVPIEGMWLPPAESEAENFEAPSTSAMVKSDEWAENAKMFWEFMGSPNVNEPRQYGPLGGGSLTGQPTSGMTDKQISDWAESKVAGFNWNLVMTGSLGQKILTGDDPDSALAFLNLLNMYDFSDGGAYEFMRAVGFVGIDPTTYLGMGVGAATARGAAKLTAKKGLTKAIQMGIIAGSAGATEGSLLAGGYDLTVQNIEKDANVREEVDLGQAAKSTAIGLGAGAVLGGGIGGLIGRRMDRMALAGEKELSRQLGFTTRETGPKGEPNVRLNEEELAQLVGQLQRASALTEQKDDIADLAMRILAGEDLPRNTAGKVDEEAMIRSLVGDEAYEAQLGRRTDDISANDPDIPLDESEKLARAIVELDELERGDFILAAPGRPGSYVVDNLGREFELMGRTKNGWYNVKNRYTGKESNLRRTDFKITTKAPPPTVAGPLGDLSPFSARAAKIIAMSESLTQSNRLQDVKITHAQQQQHADELKAMGIDIAAKDLAAHWTPAELLFLRNTYNAQAHGMAGLARELESLMRNGGKLADTDLAFFNSAHMQFIATRDLFSGVRGNAARQLNILKSRPTDEVYEFSQSLMDTIAAQGGRANTERSIRLVADYAARGDINNLTASVSKMSKKIWGTQVSSALLNIRYNFMLSSWRTHFFNFLGNSASGIYEHGLVSPTRMAINNLAYVRDLAYNHLTKGTKAAPDPSDRLTMKSWASELQGHYASFRDSIYLAKEIALGRDIGEGKVFNELGLRYDVVNVPETAFGKLGTTPVRMLEAGDALFKNQYFNSRLHFLAERRARRQSIEDSMDFETQYRWWLDNPDASMEREAKEFAAKMTYTNDPNVYGGVLAALARGAQSAQSNSLAVNMVMPFVRTPANLLSYSMEMTGLNTVVSPSTTLRHLTSSDPLERQTAQSKIVVAAGMWLWAMSKHEAGELSGTGPTNWEERKAWEAAGWQANSIMIHGKWVDMARAAPGGQSLSMIASVMDYTALSDADQPATEWIGAGLLTIADQIKDESYLSTISDLIVAIESKEQSRARSLTASTINSFLIPNILRDFRRIGDPGLRTMTGPDIGTQVIKQMKNAIPGLSDGLPPNRDWKGDPKVYYGNAYERGLIPFNIRNPDDHQDSASMALAYARIPISSPSKQLSMPGTGNSVDLIAMDRGAGFVADRYVEFVGQSRKESVNKLMKLHTWQQLAEEGNIGPGSEGDMALRRAIGIGSKVGRLRMLGWLIEHSGEGESLFKRGNGDIIQIQHQFSVDQYREMYEMVRKDNLSVPEELPQYEIQERREGPEFFKP